MSEKLDIQENNPFLTALRDCNLKISDAQILGNGHKDLMIPVPDESGKREFKKAQYFVKFPIELAEVLPGSTFSYEDFLSLLNKQGEVDEDKKLLLGKELGTYDKPQFKHEEDNFALKVFHGAGNECAMAISSLAQEVEDNGGFAQNPKLRGMLSVTRVTMTPDGKYADVMVSQLIINKEIDKLETDKELSKLNSYVRKRLGENLDLRYVPEVRMKFDDSIEYGVRINKLINEL